MSDEMTPCPRRSGGKPCQRTFGEQRCTFCDRELPLTHPTFVSEIAAMTESWRIPDDIPVEPPACEICGKPKRRMAVVSTGMGSVSFAPGVERDVCLDCSGLTRMLKRPLIEGLPALCAQLSARHDLPLRVVEQVLDDVVPMLDLLTRVRHIVDEAKGGPAMAWLDGFADIRDALYPDTELAKRQREERATRAERAAAADAAEREAWAGVTVYDPPELPRCPQCDMHMAEIAGPNGEHGFVCIKCDDLEDRLDDD